jgi:hypothetical protein
MVIASYPPVFLKLKRLLIEYLKFQIATPTRPAEAIIWGSIRHIPVQPLTAPPVVIFIGAHISSHLSF